ncbi:hypothetical protein D9757_008293 [Collybiopsis confluens]|uniref:Uncharacterized protein n=1 Tax=Collybiopsis confluens TaxID=2823264 RepID=A0A8H5H4G4_9AGAR|nr:hypothetical protein D9757_008293 [Collybiopsis confluens]
MKSGAKTFLFVTTTNMDLDADLYGDLYETDIADPAVEDKFDTSKQPAESTADTGKKPAPATSFASSSTTTTPPPPPPLSSAPLAQQIPTFEDSGTTRYRDEPSLGQSHYEQNYPVSDQHRGIRPSEMKEE